MSNTVTVTGTIQPTGTLVTTTDEASVILIFNSAISAIKLANTNTAQVGQTITYTYRVTNTGNITLTSLNASDDKLGSVSLSPTTLAPSQSASGTLTYTVLAADLPGPLTNMVVVSGTPPTGPVITAVAQAGVSLLAGAGPDNSVYLPVVVKNR